MFSLVRPKLLFSLIQLISSTRLSTTNPTTSNFVLLRNCGVLVVVEGGWPGFTKRHKYMNTLYKVAKRQIEEKSWTTQAL